MHAGDPRRLLTNVEGYLGHMKVDTVLKEVWLPRELLSDQLPGSDGGQGELSHTICKGYKNYGSVFDWLRKKGVRKIINLIVEDNERLPHSDAAIIAALEGIEVETWDWKQDDLCSDTIVSAARDAQTVFLYSSGKKAVLQSWCSNKGLNRLPKV